ncbi:hypothetical protein KJ632_05250, partial [Patescibacteria group bacterium]|nr:hypothetical protein [Patescibacteria group bacterium]
MALDRIDEIGKLKDLEYLDICKTKVEKGASFSALGNLRKLKTLKICHHAPKVADYLKNYKQLKAMD